MKRIILVILLLIIPSLLFAQEAIRTWKSQTGKTIIEAAWDSDNDSEPETVFLLKDGNRYKYPLEKLSDADKKYVTDGRAKKARRSTEGDPDLVLVDETPKPLMLGGFKLETARKFALLVGVTDYKNMNTLTCSVKDVHAIRSQLIKLGFKDNDIYTLESDAKARNLPTKENILELLDSVLKQVKTGDVVFFAFAGHGAENASGAYICPMEAKADDLSETAVPLSLIMEKIDASKADFKWLVVDACRDNPFYSQSAGTTTLLHIDDPPKGIVLLQSCAANEYSYENKETGLGLFSSSFVEALSGVADRDKDGVLTLMEVCKYTTEETNRKAFETYQKTQRPYLSGNTSDFVLMEDLKRPKAIACFNAARNYLREKKYGEAKQQIEQALKLCPKDSEYLEERDIIQGYIELMGVIPGDVTLPPEFNPTPRQYEKFWEQKGISGKIALSRDGKYLAVTCGNDIKILDFYTGMVLQTLKGHTDDVTSVNYSPDGRFTASGSGNLFGKDHTVRIWDLQTGECVKTLQGHESGVRSVNYSPDGRFIASGGGPDDDTVRIWDVQTGECVKTLEGHTSYVSSVSYSPDGRFLASGSGDDTVRIWNAQTGDCVKTLEGHTIAVYSVSYSPDGRFIASGSRDNTVRIWNAQTGECVETLEGHTDYVESVSYSPDGRFIASGSFDNTVRIWNTQAGECVKTLLGYTNSAFSVSYSPDGRFIASGNIDNTVRIWNALTGECVKTLNGHTSYVWSVSYSSDGRFVASGSWDETVRIWNTQTGECVKTLQGHTNWVNSVSYSPDGRFIASGSNDKTVRIWNAQTGECVKTLEGHTDVVRSVNYSPDGLFIASGSGDKYNTVRIWNVQTGECMKTLKGHTDYVFSVSYSPDSQFIASGSRDNTVRIWIVQTGECVQTFEGHTEDVFSVSYSPDGRFIASGSWDKTVRIWNSQTGECVKVLEGHTGEVLSVSYSPDGKYLSVGAQFGLTVWHVAE